MQNQTAPPKPRPALFAAPGKVGLKIASDTLQMTPEQARVLAENLIELAFLAEQMQNRPLEATRAPAASPGYPTSLRRPPALVQ